MESPNIIFFSDRLPQDYKYTHINFKLKLRQIQMQKCIVYHVAEADVHVTDPGGHDMKGIFHFA